MKRANCKGAIAGGIKRALDHHLILAELALAHIILDRGTLTRPPQSIHHVLQGDLSLDGTVPAGTGSRGRCGGGGCGGAGSLE